MNGDYFTEAGFETYMSLQPWNKEMEIAALPVYKNLAFVDIAGYQNSGNTVFLSENDLVAMVENIASKVGMQVVHTKVNKTTYSEEMQNAVTGIEVTTDTGSIRIDGDGKVAVNFFEGIEFPEEYKMRSQKNPGGLSLTAGLYATIANEAGEVQILDLRTGQSVNTGIRYEDVESFGDASDEHFAVAYKTGEIAIVEKTSGQLIKKTKYSLNFLPEFFGYEDDMLYVRDMESPNLLIVIKEFE